MYNISYALLESAIRPDIQLKSSRSHEAKPSGIWMTEGILNTKVITGRGCCPRGNIEFGLSILNLLSVSSCIVLHQDYAMYSTDTFNYTTT